MGSRTRSLTMIASPRQAGPGPEQRDDFLLGKMMQHLRCKNEIKRSGAKRRRIPSPRTTEIPQRRKCPSFSHWIPASAGMTAEGSLCKRGMKGGFVCCWVSIAATRAVTGSGSRATMLASIPRCCAQLAIRLGYHRFPCRHRAGKTDSAYLFPTSRFKPDMTPR